jgi:hypothetical protein
MVDKEYEKSFRRLLDKFDKVFIDGKTARFERWDAYDVYKLTPELAFMILKTKKEVYYE